MNIVEAITAQTDGGKVLWLGRRRNSFPGSCEAVWALCEMMLQRKVEVVVFSFFPPNTICSCSAQELTWMEYEVQRHWLSKPSRCAAEPFNHTHIYTAVYTLQSHNATTPNGAAAQIGHLEPGCSILTPLSIFQSVKLKFYDYQRTSEEKYKAAVSSADFIRIGKQKGPAFNGEAWWH